MSWQDRFSETTTNTAFSLTLSSVQVRGLMAIKNDTWRGSFTMFFATSGALHRRGLIEINARKTWEAPWLYRLTPAGEKVLELAIMSGAVETVMTSDAT